MRECSRSEEEEKLAVAKEQEEEDPEEEEGVSLVKRIDRGSCMSRSCSALMNSGGGSCNVACSELQCTDTNNQ